MNKATVPFRGIEYRNERGIHTALSRTALHLAHNVYNGRKYGMETAAQRCDPLTNLSLHERITFRGRSLELFAADVTLNRKRQELIRHWMNGHQREQKLQGLSL